MSGHSKWHSIKQKKGAADAKRGQIFSKLSKALTVCARDGGGDPTMNFSLRLIMEKARSANMPKENIERAIARGTGEGADGVQIQTVLYEAMGPGGAALLVEAMTDNTNRALTNVKIIFNKLGGNMGASVKWMFERKGIVRSELSGGAIDRDQVELELIEAGAEEINWDEENGLEVVSSISNLKKIKEVIEAAGFKVESADLEYLAKDKVALSSEDEEKLGLIIETLDEDEDVTNVFTNAG
ncbi:YebC/PmpR family DNA-binding transcriptional regulator [Patescibacteria group bacterium]|nr:YebC/PmpR family DNA-binding transcriptional regulator [Patescibacteria group bacterium]